MNNLKNGKGNFPKKEATTQTNAVINIEDLDEYLEQKKKEWLVELKPVDGQPKSYVGVKIESTDDLPELRNWEIKDRMYKVIGNEKVASFEIQNRHKAKSPLQYRHPETQQLYALRYATNQTSYFESLQSKEAGSVILGYIVMKNGMLFVPKENTHLQKFLAITPHNGQRFEEVNKVANAKKELDQLDLLFKAEQLVRGLDFLEQDAMCKLLVSDYSEDWEPAIVRKELFAKLRTSDPQRIINLANDKALGVKGMAKTAYHRGYIKYSNYRFMDEKDQVILEVNRNQNEWDAIANHLLTNEGNQLREYLEEKIA